MSGGDLTNGTARLGHDVKYEAKIVALLCVTFGILSLDRWMIAPLFPSIMHDLDFNYADQGALAGALSLAWGVSAAVLGGLSDKVGRRKVIIPAIIGFSIFSGLSGLATGFVYLVLIRVLMGFVEGGYTPVAIASTVEASHVKRKGLNLGIQQSSFALIGLAFGPIIATQLLRVVSWRYVFLLSVIPGIICAIICARVLKESKDIRRSEESAIKDSDLENKPPWTDIFKYRNVVLNMVALLGIMCYFFTMSAMTSTYMTDYIELDVQTMGFVISGIGIGGTVGSLFFPAISDKIGRKPALFAAFAVGIICMLLYIPQGPGANPGVLFVLLCGMAIAGYGCLMMNTAVIPTESVPPALMASASGLPIAVGECFGGGVGPIVAGQIAQNFGLHAVTFLMLGGLIWGIVVCLFIKETAPIKTGRLNTASQ